MSADHKDKLMQELRELIIEQNSLAVKSINDTNQDSFKEMYNSFYIASRDQVKATEALEKKLDDHIIRLEPVAKAFENTTWLGRLVIQVLKGLGLLGAGVGAYMVIKNLFSSH